MATADRRVLAALFVSALLVVGAVVVIGGDDGGELPKLTPEKRLLSRQRR